MEEYEVVLKNYRIRAKVQMRNEDTVVETEIRKIRAGKNVSKKSGMYQLKFGEVEIEIGEDLMRDLIELVLYMIPEEEVQKMMEEYCERRLKWV